MSKDLRKLFFSKILCYQVFWEDFVDNDKVDYSKRAMFLGLQGIKYRDTGSVGSEGT